MKVSVFNFAILKDTIFVVNTLRGGPSERLGIQSADRIVEVEGKRSRHWNHSRFCG